MPISHALAGGRPGRKRRAPERAAAKTSAVRSSARWVFARLPDQGAHDQAHVALVEHAERLGGPWRSRPAAHRRRGCRDGPHQHLSRGRKLWQSASLGNRVGFHLRWHTALRVGPRSGEPRAIATQLILPEQHPQCPGARWLSSRGGTPRCSRTRGLGEDRPALGVDPILPRTPSPSRLRLQNRPWQSAGRRLAARKGLATRTPESPPEHHQATAPPRRRLLHGSGARLREAGRWICPGAPVGTDARGVSVAWVGAG
jgi:hypothetical protein